MSNVKAAVLLASYNGGEWILKQISSILNQCDVSIKLFVSDDFSTDETYEELLLLANDDPRVVLLPRVKKAGSAGKNFYRLMLDTSLLGFDYVAFADQDDIWNLDKLSNHINLLKQHKAEAVSSNVEAFWPDGTQKLIVKSQPQQPYDFLFESAGPGCTFLMTPWLVSQVKKQLLTNPVATDVDLHDWLTYAICRANGKRWVIDSAPSMRYRQHQANVVGANSGLKPALARLKKIKSGWYRHQVALISRVVASINPAQEYLTFQHIIQSNRLLDQFRLLPYAICGRRKYIDRAVLITSILFFLF